MPVKKAVALLIAIAFVMPACNYALVGQGSSLPPEIGSVAIPQFENKTGEPNLDTIITQAVQDGFIKDGRLKVKDAGYADSVLKGAIETYSLRPVAYDQNNNVTEYVVELGMDIRHSDIKTGKIFTKQKFKGSWRYEVDASITVAESLRLSAIEEAATNAAESIVSLVIESF